MTTEAPDEGRSSGSAETVVMWRSLPEFAIPVSRRTGLTSANGARSRGQIGGTYAFPACTCIRAERLIESLDACPGDELSPAWRDVVRKRCRDMDEGSVELRAAADVFAEAYTALA